MNIAGYRSEFKREFSLLETIAFAFSIMGVIASVSSTLEFGLVSGGHVGWANITGQVALVCSIDFVCADMITSAISVASDGATNLSLKATYGILLAILFSHGIVCSAATSTLARLNLFYVVINLGTAIAAIVALLVMSENKVSTKDAFTLFENNSGWTNNDSAAHISEETAGAARAAPIAMLVGVGATAGLGWILLIVISFVIPSMSDLLASDLPLPMAQVFLDVLGKRGMLIIWSFVIVVEYVSGAAQVVDASRVVFAFARDNALPGSRWWKAVNPHTQTPVNAVWLVMVAAAICGLLGFSASALTSLAGASVIGMYTSYATPIILRITSGRDKFVPGPFNLGTWSTPIGAIAVAWVAFVIVLLLFPPAQSPAVPEMNYAIVIIMGVFIFAGLSWVISARKWFIGPIRNIDDDTDVVSRDDKTYSM
ncbi:hypothetical protein C0991_011201 [Blastosporella zonata]|nr:hypothetical protein C0991_011201 [Blastosporella zonata]